MVKVLQQVLYRLQIVVYQQVRMKIHLNLYIQTDAAINPGNSGVCPT